MKKDKEIKSFSKGNYDKYSPFEKLIAKRLQIQNHFCVKNNDPYGIDLIVYNKQRKKVGGIEIESHGKYWRKYDFPFNSLHILYRKRKYMKKNNFCLLYNVGLSNAILTAINELDKHQLVQINTPYVEAEKFYDVPLSNCVIGWDKINTHLSDYFNQNHSYNGFLKSFFR